MKLSHVVAVLSLVAACVVPPPQQAGQPGQAAAAPSEACDRACAVYAQCKGLTDPQFGAACSAECADSGTDPATVEQAAAGDCPTTIALFEGQGGAPMGDGAGAPAQGGDVPPQGYPGGAPQGGAPAYGGAVACQAPRGAGGQDAQLIQLLTSTAWCHFSYNGATTKNERVVLSPDGRVSLAGNSETSRSGELRNQYGEQTATFGAGSQSQSGDSGCWKVENSALFFSKDSRTWANAMASLSQNSNGSPIVTVGGKEYGRCD